jgi:hypothetical protein
LVNHKYRHKIPIGNGCCLQCPGVIETFPHIFQGCKRSKIVWKQCWPLLCGGLPPLVFTPNYFSLVWDNFHTTPSASACLFLLYQAGWNLWLNRNASTFRQEQRTFILTLTLEETSTLLSAVGSSLPLGPRNTRAKLAKDITDQ